MRSLRVITVLCVLILLAAACGGGATLDTKAGSFMGGALSSFAGADGFDTDARQIARDIATQREYDFTQTGYLLTAGVASSLGRANFTYTDGTGPLDIVGTEATVELQVTSNDPLVSDIEMVGEFGANDAQVAIDSPGSSFIVEWTFTFETGGRGYSLTAFQTLTGTDIREV